MSLIDPQYHPNSGLKLPSFHSNPSVQVADQPRVSGLTSIQKSPGSLSRQFPIEKITVLPSRETLSAGLTRQLEQHELDPYRLWTLLSWSCPSKLRQLSGRDQLILLLNRAQQFLEADRYRWSLLGLIVRSPRWESYCWHVHLLECSRARLGRQYRVALLRAFQQAGFSDVMLTDRMVWPEDSPLDWWVGKKILGGYDQTYLDYMAENALQHSDPFHYGVFKARGMPGPRMAGEEVCAAVLRGARAGQFPETGGLLDPGAMGPASTTCSTAKLPPEAADNRSCGLQSLQDVSQAGNSCSMALRANFAARPLGRKGFFRACTVGPEASRRRYDQTRLLLVERNRIPRVLPRKLRHLNAWKVQYVFQSPDGALLEWVTDKMLPVTGQGGRKLPMLVGTEWDLLVTEVYVEEGRRRFQRPKSLHGYRLNIELAEQCSDTINVYGYDVLKSN